MARPSPTLCAQALFCLIVLVSLWLLSYFPSSTPFSTSQLPHPLISLTSTPARLHTTLPPTLWSLVRQSHPPRRIRVYLHLTNGVEFVPDEGPATKFLPALRAAFSLASSTSNPAILHDPILVCDDDHIYTPVLVETLVKAWVERKGEAAVGLRGWRVREDLKWGVSGLAEVRRHVVEAWRLKEPYRVGVLTANEGYLIAPFFFLPLFTRTHLSSQNLSTLPSLSPLLSPASNAPSSLHLVDDILLSGSLSLSSVPRYIVPLRAPEPPNVDITPRATEAEEEAGAPRSPVEKHLKEHGKSRGEANDEALAWFGEAWARERDEEVAGGGKLWFDMRSEVERRKDGWPGEPGWAAAGRRAWSQVSKWAFYKRAQRRWGEVVCWN
ncbi:hypothetical protein JCM11641_002502 [Rhodosporidiobolus odoratus]